MERLLATFDSGGTGDENGIELKEAGDTAVTSSADLGTESADLPAVTGIISTGSVDVAVTDSNGLTTVVLANEATELGVNLPATESCDFPVTSSANLMAELKDLLSIVTGRA